MALRLKGYITESGELKVELPEGSAAGEVQITIRYEEEIAWEKRPWTEAELKEMLTPNPVPANQIVSEPLEDDPFHLDSGVIVRMMRTSIWDVCMNIKRDLED
ncbi:MAG: hypothetical protein H7175_07240 [Burkholderiales bacterium]|nr:hypothetical protein [Anaerolineae bacterium]